ncbi:unnamed protein product [Prorocentrum cordatum]|uniref:Uncharacterized protein n=1 Tax=Prorocentrum cordatum TaxID=2364126 RepID=A0ABN9QEZ3_9DINO|nr:unnamed protein product [Polarella glacialis]
MADDKTAWRGRRSEAAKAQNSLAEEFELDTVSLRPTAQAVVDLFTALCDVVPAERAPELCAARDKWVENGGGGSFPGLPDPGADEDADDGPDGSERVPGHAECRAQAGKAFRLKSRAFILTFNCLAFVAPPELWQACQSWVEGRKKEFGITYWSATMEESLHSTDTGRVHLHCYFPGANFTYEVWLRKTPLMLTTNNWTYDDYSFADKNWIQTNAVEAFVGEPAWEARVAAPAPATPPRRWAPRRREAPAGASPEHKRGGETPS